MFERYTERARRVVFFARYEASAHGSMTIETEHLLLGLVREDKSLLAHFVSGGESEILQDVERRLAVRRKVSTSIDLPLTEESKEHGVELEGARQKVKEVAPEQYADQVRQTTPEREALPESPISANHATVHALIDKVPESSLGWVKMMLDRMVARVPGSISSMAFGGPHLQRDIEGQMKEGRFTSEREENGAVVSETQHFHHGHQISVTEKFRLSEDGKKLLYSQEIVGPKLEQQHRHSMEFDVS
jgi:hypothetical protein